MLDQSSHSSSIRLSAYVELGWADVVARARAQSNDAVLSFLLEEALGGRRGGVHASAPELLVGGTARVVLRWYVDAPSGEALEGFATLVLVPVQTGRDAVTELLLDVSAPDDAYEAATAVARQFLSTFVDRIESA